PGLWAYVAAGACLPSSLGSVTLLRFEHRRKGSGVENDRDRRDLAVAYPVPLTRARARDRSRLQVVDDAHLVAVDEHLLLLRARHDPAELRQGRDVAVGVAEALDRTLEREVVV